MEVRNFPFGLEKGCGSIALLHALYVFGVNKAHSSSCMQNEKTLYGITQMYLSDNDESFPPLHYIREELPFLYRRTSSDAYISCPSIGANEYRTSPNGYAINTYLLYFSVSPSDGKVAYEQPSIKLSQIKDATRVIMWHEERPGLTYSNEIENTDIDLITHKSKSTFSSRRHLGGSNYCFIDSHTKWYRPEAINKNRKDLPTTNNPCFMYTW